MLVELGGLFLTCFLAATLLPVQSEMILAGMHIQTHYSAGLLVAVATAGNVLGAMVNWWLGRYLIHFHDRPWFPIKKHLLDKASSFYQRYGVWTLLLAWAPFIGDPLTLVAGIFRTNFLLFTLLVTIGKAGRYASIVALV